MLERGIVVSPPVSVEGNALHARSSNIDPQELRFALMFWDKLVWPSSRALHFGSGPDEEFLEEAGVLRRPEYTVDGDVAQGFVKGQVLAFRDLDRQEPGCWALAQGENSLLVRDGIAQSEGGLAVTLHRAVPIPSSNVPLADVLEVRQKRRDELLALRARMDELAADVEKAGGSPDSIAKTASEVEEACSALLQVSREWRFPVHLSNVKATFSFNAVKFWGGAVGGYTFGKEFGLVSAAAAAALSSASTLVELKGDIGLRSMKRPLSPFRYA